jgi:quinol monooxygenase YgiN
LEIVMAMVVEYIRYKLSRHTADQLIEAYRLAATHLQAAPQCLGYELSACEDESAAFVLRILWTSSKDHMEAFRKGEHFPPFLQLVRPFIDEIEEMRHYGLTDIQWLR